MLEDQPLQPAGLDRDSKLTLLHLLNLHHRHVARELKREYSAEARGASGSIAERALGGAGGVLPETKVASLAAKAVRGLVDGPRNKRLRDLDRMAEDVARALDFLMALLLR